MNKRRAAIGIAALLLAALIGWRAIGPFPPATAPLPPIEDNPPIRTLGAYLAMFNLVRSSLAQYPDVKKALDIPRNPDLPDICDRPVFVSIYRENSPPLWGVGAPDCMSSLGLQPRGGCFHDSLLCAAYQITQQKAFKQHYLLKLDQVAVRIDVVNQLRPLRASKKNLRQDLVEPGVHGLLLQNGKRLFYQPPFAYTIYSWEREERRHADRLRRQLEALADSARVGAGHWDRFPIYRLTCHSVLQHRPDFVPLLVLRDAPVIKKFSSKEIGRAAIDAGQHLTRTFDYPTQRFRPRYNPITQEKGGHFDRDIVEHAGACYSLFKLIKASRKEEFLKPAQTAFEYLVRRIEPPLLEPDLLAVQRSQSARLGSSALTLLSLIELPDRLQQKLGVERINRLARFVVEMQEDDGRFYDSYWQRLLGYMPRRPDPAFAGEALTALARYYKVNPNSEWLHAARQAADRLIERWDRRKNKTFDSWTATGLAELYEIDPNPRYAEACFAMADSLLPRQWGGSERSNPPFPDYAGGFADSSPPRTLTAARNLEALLAAHWLAYKLGRDPKPYADAVMASAYFLLQNQYRRDNSYYVNRPEETRGAFRGGLVDPLIRLPYNEHAIVALTGAYDVATMRETGQAPKEFMAEGTGDLEDKMEAGGKKE